MDTPMLMVEFDIGDQPVISGAFTDVDKVPTAPTAVTVTVRDPAGTETAYTSPDGAIELGTTTVFTFPTAVDRAGVWQLRMRATAGVLAAAETKFKVRATEFTNP